MENKPNYKNPSEQLEGLRNLIGVLIQDALTIVQSGQLGAPTMPELEKCGQFHVLLESPALSTPIVRP
jgi:hypothetical protein